MNRITTEIEFIFETDNGGTQKIVVKNAKNDLDVQVIATFANKVIMNKYFVPSSGTEITGIKEINVIKTSKETVM